MTNFEAASGLAHDLLADALPRRWLHVQRVADKASEVSSVLAAPDRPILVAAAWLHDIGYAPGVESSGLHALDGARWLRRAGWDKRVADLVAYHSCAAFEAEERQLERELRTEFRNEASDVTDALWYADMTTGPDGQDFEIMERLTEIRSRYGPDHVVTRFWSRAQPQIIAAVRRTERRLGTRKG
ncbi:HDIG domain-containing metalloprotein [Micromonospora sp. KLBMP9576]|uniref:HDIG domain-containing metalloprotein n=1 Tax=Micromonospora sp. KLBMP9576 TaxID=3424769 RepID=UPI003D91B282